MINKINFTQTNLEKREEFNKISNERGHTTIATSERQKIMRDWYKQSYTNKLSKLGEMDKFPETHNLSRWNYGDTETLNRLIMNREI